MTWKNVANTYRNFSRFCDRRIERARTMLAQIEGKTTHEAADYLTTVRPSLLEKLHMREPLTSIERKKLVTYAVKLYTKSLSDNLTLKMVANAAAHLADRQAYIRESTAAADAITDPEYYRALSEYEERAVRCISEAELF